MTLTTTLSSRGQIVIPKELRDARRWPTGTTFVVEEVAQGILLKPVSALTPSALDAVMGCTAYRGPAALSQADIDATLDADVARRRVRK